MALGISFQAGTALLTSIVEEDEDPITAWMKQEFSDQLFNEMMRVWIERGIYWEVR